MKRARIIYNPTSGREAMRKALPDVLEGLERAGYEASAHATTGEGDATYAAKVACEREYDIVIAAGGDGTVNEVIDGMAREIYRPKLGILPMGTTNDFARAIRVPRDLKKALNIIIDGYTKRLDIGKVNDHHFMNIAGGGRLTELTYEVPSKLKTVLGQLAYYLKGIEMLPSLKPSKVRIEYNDEVLEEEIMLFLVSNSNSVGGFERLAPHATMDDGYFDLMILKKINLAELVLLANKALRGSHIEDENVIYAHTNEVKVIPEETMQLNLDGEYGGTLPGKFEVLHKHIEFFLPKEELEA
ncbi:diacylglycerol kinase [Tenuibacillus multivorans]|uniref:Diacylglycerol kinase (ATP) n=1 Tax=Tenuibacillus multivorans TaxID=237069 RepID=A0A1H0E0I7_9BACI|nr:diacylglycerol kinase [Tenuibacillus multivorans]GEL76706.1 diacylglycerol kinase [Tenuibacillus multivorans]SDN75783.1 diacylglycerol kinase (ATP) [Tenuibacillus multivorans]